MSRRALTCLAGVLIASAGFTAAPGLMIPDQEFALTREANQ